MAKRQRTEWYSIYPGADRTFIRAGRVFNPRWDCKKDLIRLQMQSASDLVDLYMTRTEAVVVSAALSKTVAKDVIEHNFGDSVDLPGSEL